MQQEAVANEGWIHVAEGSAITYAHNPPASGPHYPVWLRYEEFTAALAEYADRTAARTLLQLVRQADRWAAHLALGGRHCSQVAVDLGLQPAVRLLFTPPAGDSVLRLTGPTAQDAESLAAGGG